jgi:molybdopterin molybdotransferase
VRDDRTLLEGAIRSALDASDLVAFSGGISMGRFDHVREVLLALGVEERVWKVAQRPGGPFFFGARGRQPVFGLPGNPVSSFVCFMEYAWPSIEAMSGLRPARPVGATLDAPFPRDAAKHRFLFGRARLDHGRLLATPSRKLGSHMLSSSLEANAILGSEPGEGAIPAGGEITLRLLPWATLGEDG